MIRRTPMRRTPTKIAGRSARTVAELPIRAEVRRLSLERAGHRCEMAALVPEVKCGGLLEVDEFEGRGVNPGAHLDAAFTRVACQLHHRWKTEHPALALERGLRQKSTFELRRNMNNE